MAPQEKGLRRPDLAGKTVLPGLIDTHAFFPWTAPSLAALDVGEVKDHPALKSFVSQTAAESPPGQLILGLGFTDTRWTQRPSPVIDALDAVASENPAYLIGVTGHRSAVNSRALELLAPSQVMPGVMRDAAGQPTGLLADEANRSAIRLARHITGRSLVLVFNYCYDGTADEAFATLWDGVVVSRAECRPASGPGADQHRYRAPPNWAITLR